MAGAVCRDNSYTVLADCCHMAMYGIFSKKVINEEFYIKYLHLKVFN